MRECVYVYVCVRGVCVCVPSSPCDSMTAPPFSVHGIILTHRTGCQACDLPDSRIITSPVSPHRRLFLTVPLWAFTAARRQPKSACVDRECTLQAFGGRGLASSPPRPLLQINACARADCFRSSGVEAAVIITLSPSSRRSQTHGNKPWRKAIVRLSPSIRHGLQAGVAPSEGWKSFINAQPHLRTCLYRAEPQLSWT